jgi:hypothetical protein
MLAGRYGVTLDTIYRWRGRTSFEDRSHTAHQLATTRTLAQESVVAELRRMLLLPLNDLLAVTREFLNPDVSRSGLDRCLRRHGVSNLNALRPKTPAEPHKAFQSYEPGFLHVDIKYLARRWRMRQPGVMCSQPLIARHGGLCAHPARHDRSECPQVPARSAQGLPDPDYQNINR